VINNVSWVDITIFIIYNLLGVGIGFYVSRRKKGKQRSTSEYFLAGKTLPWWAVGAALIAANISAEQLIGMCGSSYVIGIAVASYEWMSALTLIIVAKFLLPVYLKNNIMTMPQFLEKRFDNRVRTSLAVFWLMLYVFINLTTVLYLGALFLNTVLGINMIVAILILVLFTALYSIYGGLMAVAWTDVIHVFFLIAGGILVTVIALSHVSLGHSLFAGMKEMFMKAPEKFDLILSKNNKYYDKLPGISVLIGGMWLGNLSYWGFNQYVTQKAFAAKNLKEAQLGTMFAGYLKLLMPFIVVLPGIIAFVLKPDINPPDRAYPWLLSTFVPSGMKGITIGALFAAIVSALCSITNSTATIFTMDIYKQFFKKELTESHLVKVGRITSASALFVATIIAIPLLSSLDQVFQFIQDYNAYLSPLIVLIFGAGIFWKRTTANAVLWAAIATLPLSVGVKMIWPHMPFMNREVLILFILLIIVAGISYLEKQKQINSMVRIEKGWFHTSMGFNIGAIGICTILTVLYILLW